MNLFNDRDWTTTVNAQPPSSTEMHPQFLDSLPETLHKLRILDAGCGDGKKSAESFGKLDCQIVGLDINFREFSLGAHLTRTEFVCANAVNLPFRSQMFDVIVALGLLGGVDKHKRQTITSEFSRVVRSGGLLYLAEFGLVSDPSKKDANGDYWVNRYARGVAETGEYGSFEVHWPDGTHRFTAHHFQPAELVDLLEGSGFRVTEILHVAIKSTITGHARPGLSIWGNRD